MKQQDTAQALVKASDLPEMPVAVEKALIQGDLSSLKPEERISYYKAVCDSLGLNPLTKPFEYIYLNGKLTLYVKRDCTDQLRQLKEISVVDLQEKMLDDIYIVTATVKTPSGRTDSAKGAIALHYPQRYKDDGKWVPHPQAGKKFQGEELANAIMKAETKAKRRATLSICGLGWMEESEVESVQSISPAEEDQSQPKPEYIEPSDIQDEHAELRKKANELMQHKYVNINTAGRNAKIASAAANGQLKELVAFLENKIKEAEAMVTKGVPADDGNGDKEPMPGQGKEPPKAEAKPEPPKEEKQAGTKGKQSGFSF